MLLLLIRHAETEHNVAGLLAGITDSRLTTHGAIQIQRLARYLAQQKQLAFTHIFSSDLTRARLTADAILDAQVSEKRSENVKIERIVLEGLRERDFGSLECQPWASKPNVKRINSKFVDPDHPDFQPKETHEAMATRMNTFLDDDIHPILASDCSPSSVIAVVSHGIVLSILWRALLQRFGPNSVSLGPGLSNLTGSRPLEYLPSWSNTGYLELEIRPAPVQPGLDAPQSVDLDSTRLMLSGYQMLIKTVNAKDHLNNLKRTRGGLGSSTFDGKQKRLEGFFKKPKTDAQSRKPD